MKLKKILAGTLAATLVMTGVPNAGFTVFAETDVLSDTGASDEGISALAAEDAMPAPYGYQNLQLTVNDNVTVTTNKSDTPVAMNILTNDDNAFFSLDGNTDGRPWMNFHFKEPQTVAGLTYYLTKGQDNGYAKTVKIEIKTSDSDEYKTVYENETAWAKDNNAHTAIFTPVSNVTDVKFHAVTTYYAGASNHLQIKKMRIMTAPEGTEMVTATAVSGNEALGTAMADVSDAKAKADTVQVMPGVAVKYQATVANETTGRFAGWQDAQGNIVSRDRVYTTVLEKDTKLTAKFETGTSARINIPLGDNMTWQSANPANIKASSDRAAVNANDMDGRAWYAFDRNSDGAANTNTHWHSDYSNNGATSPGRVRANNPIWIQAGFNEAKNVSKITYQTRKSSADASCCAKKYQILAANMSTPTQTPQDEDFAVVCEGEFKPEKTAQEVDFPVTVKATHIRLKVLSTQTENDFITASNIEMYEFNGGEVKNLIDAPAVAVDSASEGMGTVSRSATKVVEGLNTEVTYTATPKAGSRFVKWVDKNGNAIENAGASYTITVNGTTADAYKAVFENKKINQIALTGKLTENAAVPELTVNAQTTDGETVSDYITTSGTKWTLDGEEISTYPDATKKVTLETVLSALEGFVISDDAAVTVNGKTAALTKQQDGTVKLTVNISSTRKEYTAAGEYTGTDELEFYNDLKKITVTVTGKVKEKANKAYSLFTLEGNNNNYFTVWYNPKTGTMCYTSKDMGTNVFWSGKVGTTDAGKHFKASFSLAQLSDGNLYMMCSVNGSSNNNSAINMDGNSAWDTFGKNFLVSHSWNAEKVMIGKKPTGIDKTFGNNGSLSDFDGTISKVVVTNGIYGDSTVLADATNNLIAENNKVTEDVALQAKATEYRKIGAYGYELAGWNVLQQLVNDAKAGMYNTDWLILDAMDAMDAAKENLAKRQITVTTAGEHVTCTGAGTYAFGGMVNLSAQPEAGYEFKGWKDENGSIVSKDAAYTMLAENNITLTAVCTPVPKENTVTITFKTGDRFSDQICGEPVQAAVGDQITVPAHKDYYGYTFEGWDSNGDGVADITGVQAEAGAKYTVTERVTTLLAVYKIEKETYTVNVTNGNVKGEDTKAANGTYEEGSVVTVTADAAEEGKEFKEWQSDGMVVSTNATYSFIVKKNMNLTAVYADKGSAEVRPVVSFTNYSRKVLAEENKDQVKMVISWSGVTGCQIVSIGALRTYDATLATEDNLVLDNRSTAIKNGKYTKISNSGTFTGSLKIGTTSKAKTLYARGYITYKDAQGNIHAVYTDIKTIAHPAE